MTEQSLISLENLNILAEGLDHPEAVASGLDGFVYAGGEAGQIYRIHPKSGQVDEIANTGGFILGLCLDADNNIYACDEALHKVFRITRDGTITIYSEGTTDRPMVLPNYPVFDSNGNLYVSDSGDWDGNNGCIFKVDKNGETSVIYDEPLAFPNGMALSDDSKHLYVILSNQPGVVRFPLYDDHTVGSVEHIIDLPDTVPDGLAFDSENNLYISCYTPDRIYRLGQDGTLEILIEDRRHTDLCSPTNIAFFGENLEKLAIASLGGWNLMQVKMTISGHSLHYPTFR